MSVPRSPLFSSPSLKNRHSSAQRHARSGLVCPRVSHVWRGGSSGTEPELSRPPKNTHTHTHSYTHTQMLLPLRGQCHATYQWEQKERGETRVSRRLSPQRWARARAMWHLKAATSDKKKKERKRKKEKKRPLSTLFHSGLLAGAIVLAHLSPSWRAVTESARALDRGHPSARAAADCW